MQTVKGIMNEFPITIGLHEGYVMSPYLFALAMDDLTNCIPWPALFADDIGLIDQTKSRVNESCSSGGVP